MIQAIHGATLRDRDLHHRIAQLRAVDLTNLKWLAVEYTSLAAVLGGTIAFCEWRIAANLGWWWSVPVVALAVFLIGALQHRLAGLGHEAAHYTLFPNKLANELASDFFCMFPLFATTHQYRMVHQAHHQYTNDWERDPDLANIGHSKLMDRFPMRRGRVLYNYFFRFFLPPVLLHYVWDVVRTSALGQGVSPYADRTKPARLTWRGVRLTSILGVVYAFSLSPMLIVANRIPGMQGWWTIAGVAAGGVALCAATIWLLPEAAFFRSPLKCVFSMRTLSFLRLVYYTGLLTTIASLKRATGINFGAYFWLLWFLPLMTTFGYFMLLRDVYQHANADDGRLTNSRVFFVDRFTRWAVFVYGQDMHVPHHLYPTVPHYSLPELHSLLREESIEYADQVVECHGTFGHGRGRPTILDVLERPRLAMMDD